MFELVSFFATSFTAIFVIIDPFAVIPIYLTITEKMSDNERLTVCRKASLVALLILMLFTIFGISIFNIFGITLPAFQIAGGILLLLLGIAQLSADRRRVKPEEQSESMEKDDVSVFPLGMPLLAGPGAISTVVLLSSQTSGLASFLALVCSVICVVVASYICLLFAPKFSNILGRTGLNLLTRLMGIVLTAIAVQFIINGVSEVVLKLSGKI